MALRRQITVKAVAAGACLVAETQRFAWPTQLLEQLAHCGVAVQDISVIVRLGPPWRAIATAIVSCVRPNLHGLG
jgi:hypothetical protein